MATPEPAKSAEEVTVTVCISRATFNALMPQFLPALGNDLATLKAIVLDLVIDRKATATRADLLEILEMVEDIQAQTNGGR